MNEDNSTRKLYDALLRDGYSDLGNYEQFEGKLKDSGKREKLYGVLQSDGYTDIGSLSEFNAKLGYPDPAETAEQPQGVEQPEKKRFWDSFAGDFIEKTGGQALSLLGGGFGFLDRQVQNVANMGLGAHGGAFGDTAKMLNENAEKLLEKGKRYGNKNFADFAREGDYASAVGDLVLEGGSMIIPQLAAAVATGGTSALGLMGASAYSHKLDQLDEDNPDMGDVAKQLNAITTASAEVLSEKLSLAPMAKWLKGIYSKMGKEAAEESVRKGLQGWIEGMYKNSGVLFSPVWEGATEMASQLAENITDKITGADPDRDMRDGLLESFAYGVSGGGVVSTAAVPGQAVQTFNKIRTSSGWRKSKEEFNRQFEGDKTVGNFIEGINAMNPEEQESVLALILKDKSLKQEQKNAAANLIAANNEYRTYRTPEAIRQDREARRELQVDMTMRAFDSEYQPLANENGFIQKVVVDGNEESPVHITKGNVVYDTDIDGRMRINHTESSPELYYTDAEGKTQVVTPRNISQVLDVVNFQEMRSELEVSYRQLLASAEQADKVTADDVISNGDEVVYVDEKGNTVTGVVVDASSSPEHVMLEDGKMIEKELVTRTDVIDPIPSASAVTEPQPEAVSPVQPYAGVDNPVDAGQETIEPALSESSNLSEKTPENEIVPPDRDSKVSFLNQIPLRKGKKESEYAFEEAPVEITLGALQEVYDPEEMSDRINATLENIQKRIEKASKIKFTGDPNRDIANKQKSRLEIADLQNRLNYWKGVQNLYSQAHPVSVKDQVTEQLTGSMPENTDEQQDYTEYVNNVVSQGNDIPEIVGLYRQEMENVGFESLEPWQQQLIGRKVNRASFERWADKNYITPTIARSWFNKKGEDRSLDALDTLAEELSEYGMPVSIQNIVDFILDHPGNRINKGNETTRLLNNRFKEVVKQLTGEDVGNIDSRSGRLIIAGIESGRRSAEEQSVLPYSGATIPDAFYNFIEATETDIDRFDSFEDLRTFVQDELDNGTFEFPLSEQDYTTIIKLIDYGINESRDWKSFAERVEKGRNGRAAQPALFEGAAEETTGRYEIRPIDTGDSGRRQGIADNTDYITNFAENEGDEIPERVPQRADGKGVEVDRRVEEAAPDNRRGETSTSEARQIVRGKESKHDQLDALETYAKEKGVWFEDASILGEQFSEGGENEVRYNQSTSSVFKLNNFEYAGDDAINLFDRIDTHNLLFPNSHYTLVGFAKNSKGNISAVLEQPFVVEADRLATPEEIANYMRNLGFRQTEDDTYVNNDYEVFDALSNNVLLGADGSLYPIDTQIRKNVQSQAAEQKETPIVIPENATALEIIESVAGQQAIREAEREVNTTPTDAQKEAGNYKKGHVTIQGFDISIEQPKGSVRSGVDENGKAWSQVMNNTYGYFRGTESRDGDQIDVFLGDSPNSGKVFVVDQVNPGTGRFDEHKVMLGFDSVEEARDAYLSNYEEGWQGLGDITEADVETFRKWAGNEGRRIKSFKEYKDFKRAGKNIESYGSNNTLISRERYEELRKQMRSKLNGLNVGFDPELFAIGTQMAMYHIEAGARRLSDFSRRMIDDLGNEVRPYLKSFYEAARHAPGMEKLSREMDPYKEVAVFDVDNFDGNRIFTESNKTSHETDTNERSDNSASDDGRVPAGGAAPDVQGRTPSTEREDRGESKESPRVERHDTAPGREAGRSRGDHADTAGTGLRSAESKTDSNNGRTDQGNAGSSGQPLNRRNNRQERGESIVPKGNAAKITANIAAIKLAKRLTDSGGKATPEQMAVLRKYTGWGGLSSVFQETDKNYQALKDVLTEEEYDSARASTTTAFYTPPEITASVWDMIGKLGFKGGHILEPSAGIGNFFALMPESISGNSSLRGIELDDISGAILKLLYPDAQISISGYEKQRIPNNSIDLVVSNVPFGNFKVYDTNEKDISNQFDIHDYFIAKSIRKLKPGGIGVFITTSSTLDKSTALRNWVINNGNADFIDAVRLNTDTFKNEAGTEATSDIIIIRKRDERGRSAYEKNMQDSVVEREATYKQEVRNSWGGYGGEIDKTARMTCNKYFAENPGRMAGEMKFGFEGGNALRPAEQRLAPVLGIDQQEVINRMIEELPNDIYNASASEQVSSTVSNDGTKEGGLTIIDGKPYIVSYGTPVAADWNANKVAGHTKTEALRDYLELKNTVNELLEAENSPDDEPVYLNKTRKKLNEAYDSFVNKYGYLNENRKIGFLQDDVDFTSIAAIENMDDDPATGEKMIGKSDIFTKRVIDRQAEPKANNVTDAVRVSMNLFGKIDIPYIARLIGKNEENVKNGILDSRIGFVNPETGLVEERNKYLSGNVREKLASAEQANGDGDFESNIEELSKIIPTDIPVNLIKMTLGTTWIPDRIYNDFFKDQFDVNANIKKTAADKFISSLQGNANAKDRQTGMPGANGSTLALNAMNNTTTTIYKYEWRDGRRVTVTDPVATAQAAAKQTELAETFEAWIKQKKEYAEELERTYNKVFNAVVNPKTDVSSFDRFPGVGGRVVEIEKVKLLNGSEINQFRFARENTPADNDKVREAARKYKMAYNEKEGIFATDSNRAAADFVKDANGTAKILREHQKEGVLRGLEGATLLAHEVGTGKTLTLITTAMEMRRLGLAKKPVIVVQRSTYKQFVKEIKNQYPGAKVLAPAAKDLTAKQRQQLFAKIAYNDWDIIVLYHSYLDSIPDDPKRVAQYIEEKIEDKMAQIAEMEAAKAEKGSNAGRMLGALKKEVQRLEAEREELLNPGEEPKGKRKRSVKDIEKARSGAAAKAEASLDRRTDNVLNFEQLGVDALLIDEAHAYKKLGFVTSLQRVKGIDTGESKRAQSTKLKSAYILENHNGKNVVFATGTPISNTMAEMWTFLRYLLPKSELARLQMNNFDAFVNNFGSIEEGAEFGTNGKFRITNRFSSYSNVPELINIWRQVAHTVLTEEVASLREGVGTPRVQNGKPTDIMLEQTPALKAVMKGIKKKLEEFEKMTGTEKKQNSHIPLVMFGLAKRAAIDVRLVDPGLTDDTNSKTNRAVDEIMKGLDSTSEYRGTVAIFCDSYQSSDRGFNLFRDIKRKLIEKGIRPEQVAIINDYERDDARERLFAAINAGDVRVIMGTTEKLGVGVNIQERLYMAIHMDAPLRPSDYQQRNGRIIRQGNSHLRMDKTVEIQRIGVQKTLDVTGYQRLEIKKKFIDQIMKGDVSQRMIEEADIESTDSSNFNQMMANLSGSQAALALSIEQNKLKKLQNALQYHKENQIFVSDAVRRSRSVLAETGKVIGRLEKYKSDVQKVAGDKIISITIGNTTATTSDEIETLLNKGITKKIDAEVEALRNDFTREFSILKTSLFINDVKVNIRVNIQRNFDPTTRKTRVTREIFYTSPDVSVDNPYFVRKNHPQKHHNTELIPVFDDSAGAGIMNMIGQINYQLAGSDVNTEIRKRKTGVDKAERDIAVYEPQIGQEFPKQKELEATENKVAELEVKMREELRAIEEEEAKESIEATDIDRIIEEEEEILFRNAGSLEEDFKEFKELKEEEELSAVNERFNEELERQVKGTLPNRNTSEFSSENPDIRFRFIGERGAANLDAAEEVTIRLDNLSVAREMETAEKEAKTIKMATGWERGADGKWRYEVDDIDLNWHPDNSYDNGRGKIFELFTENNNKKSIPLYEIVDEYKNNPLFIAYPSLLKVRIRIANTKNSGGHWDRERNEIVISRNNNLSYYITEKAVDQDYWIAAKSTLVHEIQHAIQSIEGFAKGDNPQRLTEARLSDLEIEKRNAAFKIRNLLDFYKNGAFEIIRKELYPYTTFSDMDRVYAQSIRNYRSWESAKKIIDKEIKFYQDKLDAYEPIGYERYMRASGEVESRNVSKRMDMTEAERRTSLAEETEDVAREDQIFIKNTLNELNSQSFRPESKAVNARFNSELEQQIVGALPKGHVYQLGNPSDILQAAGIPDLPIELESSRLNDKSNQENHPFELSEVKDLPDAIQNPIAVFDSTKKDGSKVVLTELQHEGNNYVVIVRVQNKGAGRKNIQINDIRSIYPKDHAAGILDWINSKDNLLKWVDKEKALNFISVQWPNYIGNGNKNQDLEESLNFIQTQWPNYIGGRSKNQGLLSATNIVSNFENPTKKEGEIVSAVEELADSLHTPVKIVRDVNGIEDKDAGMQKRKRGSKGWYEPKTGEIFIVLPNAASVADAQATVLHEAVGHRGLRGLLGERFDLTMRDVFNSLPEDIQSKYLTLHKSEVKAAEEYASEMAEAMSEPSIIQKIVSAVRRAFRSMGIELKMTDGDIMYMLWKSRNRLENNATAFEEMDHIRREERVKNISGEYDAVFRAGDALDSMIISEEKKQKLKSKMSAVRHTLYEAYVDHMITVRELQERIAEQTGKAIPDYMNVYMYANALPGRNKHEMEEFTEKRAKPLQAAIRNIVKAGLREEELKNYVRAKHGLERNEYMRMQQLRRVIEKIEDESLRDTLLSEIDGKRFSEIGSLSVETYNDLYNNLAEKDFSGLTAIQEELGDVSIEEFIKDTEDTYGRLTDELWRRIRAVNDFSLRKWYDSGMISRAAYEKISGMYQYYVPLRGFDELEAHDVYEYYTQPDSAYNDPLKTARGRTSKSDDPFPHMLSMAETAIVGGNKNMMKLYLYRLAQIDPSGIMTVSRQWHVKTGEDMNGESVFEIKYPEYDDNPEQYRKNIEAFNAEMLRLESEGLAFTKRSRLNTGYRISKGEANEHVVSLRLNGEDYQVLFHGSPRAAQAINGLNQVRSDNPFWKKVEWMNRQMAANYTTRNPAFVLSNLARDTLYATASLTVKEGRVYRNRFIRNIPKASGALIRRLREKPDMSNPVDVMLQEFIENGGQTGYTALYGVEKYRKELKNSLKTGMWKNTKDKLNFVKDIAQLPNQWAEDLSRFSTYMASRQEGRSILRSVNDAKEVTLNFNTQGSGAYGNFYARKLFLFFNAAVQGLRNFSGLAIKAPFAVAKLVMKYAAVGYIQPYISELIISLLGDDEDRDAYNNLPDYVRKNNFCIPLPGTGGFLKIPLPIELRAFYGLGDTAYRVITGKDELREGLANVFFGFADLLPLNPVGGSSKFTPASIKPVWEAYISNEDFTGKPIAKITPFNEYDPEYQRVYRSTSVVPVKVSQFLNHISRSEDVGRGSIEINPAKLEHLYEGYLGGMFTTANQTFKTLIGAPLGLNEFQWRGVPVLNRFFDTGEVDGTMMKVNEKYFKYLDEMRESKYILREYKKATDEGTWEDSKRAIEFENSDRMRRAGYIEEKSSLVEDLSEEAEETDDKAIKEDIQDEINLIKKEMVEALKNGKAPEE